MVTGKGHMKQKRILEKLFLKIPKMENIQVIKKNIRIIFVGMG